MTTTTRVSEEKVDRAVIDKRAPSVARLLIDRVAATPDAEAFRFPDGKDGWTSVTWEQTGDRVRLLAAGLISLGIEPEDRVALASSTRYEWVLGDLAVMCAGAATTTVYPTTHADDVAFIVADSGSRIVIAEDTGQVEKLVGHRDDLPDVTKVVVLDGTGDGDWVITFDELAELGRGLLAEDSGAVLNRIHSIRAEHLATLIYTSGTTGKPKGVRLPHSAWTYEAAAI
ncbi:MAG: AMP-binding protein, partial [Rhodococcus sp. (in: high G+C Gram-positive bacteria)]